MTFGQLEAALRRSDARDLAAAQLRAQERLAEARTRIFEAHAAEPDVRLAAGIAHNDALAVAQEWGVIGSRGGCP